MDSDCEYEDSGEEDSYDYTGEESSPEEVAEERCRFDWQDEELHNQDRGEFSPVVCRAGARIRKIWKISKIKKNSNGNLVSENWQF